MVTTAQELVSVAEAHYLIQENLPSPGDIGRYKGLGGALIHLTPEQFLDLYGIWQEPPASEDEGRVPFVKELVLGALGLARQTDRKEAIGPRLEAAVQARDLSALILSLTVVHPVEDQELSKEKAFLGGDIEDPRFREQVYSRYHLDSQVDPSLDEEYLEDQDEENLEDRKERLIDGVLEIMMDVVCTRTSTLEAATQLVAEAAEFGFTVEERVA